MAEVVNLRQARKRAARAEKDAAAEANRAASSIPGRVRSAARQEEKRVLARLDAHRLTPPDTDRQRRGTSLTVKRSLAIRGHRTSISIEDAFWSEFQAIADRHHVAVAALVADVDAKRDPSVNLSSAVRLFVLADALARADTTDQLAGTGTP